MIALIKKIKPEAGAAVSPMTAFPFHEQACFVRPFVCLPFFLVDHPEISAGVHDAGPGC
jgi:hypothetical protein